MMNRELQVIDAANTRWKKRQWSRIGAISVGILSLFWFAVPAHPQNPLDDLERLENSVALTKPSREKVEPMITNLRKWVLIAQNKQGKFYYKGSARSEDNDVGVWLKIVPTNPKQMVAAIPFRLGRRMATGLHYGLQYTVFHCDEGRMSVEKTTLYRRNGSVIISDSVFTTRSHEPIEPESTNAEVFRFFCTPVIP